MLIKALPPDSALGRLYAEPKRKPQVEHDPDRIAAFFNGVLH